DRRPARGEGRGRGIGARRTEDRGQRTVKTGRWLLFCPLSSVLCPLSSAMKIVVGLGNPGRQYAGTRHNVGFDVVEALAAGPGVAPFRGRFQAQVAEANEGGQPVLLVKPETFMNLSGQTVRQLVDFYKLPLTDLLVVCDDFALPLGKL